jgi:hypothetical protein
VARSGERSYISDGRGGELLLRGVNSNHLVEYPAHQQQTVPLTRADVREMAALGFNFLRLPFNWSRLAPAPGQFSRAYLREIERAVDWAEGAGMWVLVDSHQDRYNRNLRPGDEADGAPDWATFTDGKPCAPGPLTSPCSQAAYDNFWNDRQVAGQGLQQHYLEALLAVSRRLRDHPRLLGIELMNEPTPGSVGSPDWERRQLWPFNRRMIAGLRADGERRMIWFGPTILRDVIDFDPGKPERFSDDGNLVYGPHIYTGVFNSGGVPELGLSMFRAEGEARAYRAAWVNAEWGGRFEDGFREHTLDLLDVFRVGSGAWMWKQRPGFYDWHTVEVDGGLRSDGRAQLLSRPHVDTVPGELVSTRYEAGRLQARVLGRGGTARLWSGTVVLRGGENVLGGPLVRALVDGRRAPVRLERRRYDSAAAELEGFRVYLRLPPGAHELVLEPGSPR